MSEPRISPHAVLMARMKRRLAHWSVPADHTDAGPGEAPLRGLSLPRHSSSSPMRDDFSHALLDAWATVADVLSFYEERFFAEGYLSTATEDLSVQELVRTLGVEPQPPLSARVDLCFTVSTKPSAPEEILLPAGLATQSVPPPGAKAQIFETSAPLLTRAVWNAMTPWRPSEPQGSSLVAARVRGLLLEGGSQGLRPGDVVLLEGQRSQGQAWAAVATLRRLGQSRRRGCMLLVFEQPIDAALGSELLSEVRVWSCRPLEALFGAEARRWAELSLEEKLEQHATPVGGLQRLGAAQQQAPSRWESLELRERLGSVRCLLADGGKLYAGVEGRCVLRSEDGGDTWQATTGTLSRADVLCLTRDGEGRLVAGTLAHGVLRSADGGVSWQVMRGKMQVERGLNRQQMLEDLRLPALPVRSIAAFTAGSGSREGAFVLAGTDEGLFCWEEAFGTWRPANDGLPLAHKGGRALLTVRAIALDTVHALYLIGTREGVFATRQVGDDPWERRDPARQGEAVSALAVDAEGTLFVALEKGGLYRSSDGGQHYTSISPSSTAVVQALLLQPPVRGEPATLVAATQEGLFRSSDGGLTWAALPAPSNPQVTSLAAPATGVLVAATPLTGVVEVQWPGWDLGPERLELSRVASRLVPGQPLVLEQRQEDGTARRAFLTLQSVESVHATGFELRQRVSRLEVQPPLESGRFDRSLARVRLVGATLTRWPLQVRQDAMLDTTDLDALLDADASFDALVRDALPLEHAPQGNLVVEGTVPDPTGRAVLVVGRRMRAQVASGATLPPLRSDDGLSQAALEPGQVLEVMGRPRDEQDGVQLWRLRTERGFTGTTRASPGQLSLLPAAEGGASAVERRTVVGVDSSVSGVTGLVFDAPLEELIDPDTLVVNGNVVEALHGGSVTEVLGSGDATQAHQRFRLKRTPLAWQATEDGPVPELEVRVDGQRWQWVQDFSEQPSASRSYTLRLEASGSTLVCFGDGMRGARLPTGTENVTATYRVGGGSDGNVEAGRIRLLRQRPMGLKGVNNPRASGGGIAAEASSSLRQRAPLEVRTLGRIVSLRDFADFVRAYPGVTRSRATRVWDGKQPLLFIAVATEEEASEHRLVEGSSLEEALSEAIADFRTPNHDVRVGSYVPRYFAVEATLTVDPDFVAEEVQEAARGALAQAFSFEQRELAQAVATSDLLRQLTSVRGVLNARIQALYPQDGSPATGSVPTLLPGVDTHWDAAQGKVVPAEMWLLDTVAGITLHVEEGP